MILAVSVILAAILVVSLTGNKLGRWQVTVPMTMVIAGLVVGWDTSLPIIQRIADPSSERVVEVVLALLLFLDATEVQRRWRGNVVPLLRLVLLGVPLCILVTAIAAAEMFPGERLAMCLVLACITVPTDMAPAASIVSDRRIPARVRDLLNTESGYNDGIVAPIFLFAMALVSHGDEADAGRALDEMIPSALHAIVIGLVIGGVTAWCARKAVAGDWASQKTMGIGMLAVPLLTYTVALGLEGNGFVAAFVAGLAFRSVYGPIEHSLLQLGEGVAAFVVMPLWFILGQLFSLVVTEGFEPRALGFALLSLTLLRVVPILLVLTPSRMPWRERLLLSWLGPRGIASVVFAMLALAEVTEPEEYVLLLEVLVYTVVGSILLHGISAPLLGWAFERSARRRGEPLEGETTPGPATDVTTGVAGSGAEGVAAADDTAGDVAVRGAAASGTAVAGAGAPALTRTGATRVDDEIVPRHGAL